MSTAEGRRYIRTPEFANLKEHVLSIVRESSWHGATNLKVVSILNEETPEGFTAYSNPVSGALSRLHNIDLKIARLTQKRGGFSVYVATEYLDGRDHYPARPPAIPNEGILEDLQHLVEYCPADYLRDNLQAIVRKHTDPSRKEGN